MVMPEARNPAICDEVNPLALPILPLQKIIAVAADARAEPAANCNRIISARPARQADKTPASAQL